MTRETHHKRCTISHLFSSVVKHVLLACLRLRTRTSTLRMNAGVTRALLSVSSPPSFRPSSSARDVFWERALSGLPDQLLSALRAAELDEPGVLLEYPKMTVEELKGTLGEALGDHVAPSGAASSGQPTISSLIYEFCRDVDSVGCVWELVASGYGVVEGGRRG